MDVKTLCLGLLSRGDASGYELKKQLEGPLGHVVDASFGSIYPALAQLAADGLVSVTTLAQNHRPDKKVYSLTPKGRLAFLDALAGPIGRDRFRSDLAVTLLFVELLSPRQLAELIDLRLKQQSTELGALAASIPPAEDVGARFIHGFAAAMLEAARRHLDDNRHFLESATLAGSKISDA